MPILILEGGQLKWARLPITHLTIKIISPTKTVIMNSPLQSQLQSYNLISMLYLIYVLSSIIATLKAPELSLLTNSIVLF